jgi:hypothetical protein
MFVAILGVASMSKSLRARAIPRSFVSKETRTRFLVQPSSWTVWWHQQVPLLSKARVEGDVTLKTFFQKKLAGRRKNRRRHCMKTKSNKIGDNAAQLCFGDPARTAAGKFPTACGDTLRGTRPRIIGKLSSPLDARALAVPTFAITAGRRITGKRNKMKIQTHQRTLASPVNMRWAHAARRPTGNPPTQSDRNMCLAVNNPTGATSL